ncbi:MAG: DUF3540 domain-containing protein [Nitrospirota bacterium]|nr:DUF3540 domain-containing protein [Nitrospirota bacterium]
MLTETVLPSPSIRSSLLLATVTEISGASVAVDLEGERFWAVRSTGCLLDPRVNDQAVVLFSESRVPVILAIVDPNPGLHPRTMSFSGGISILVNGGALTIQSSEGVSILSEKIELESKKCRGVFSDLSIIGESLSFTGGVLSFVAHRISTIGRTIERVAEWISEHAHMSTRTIDTIDRSVSGQTQIEADGVVSIQSKTTLLSSEDLVKIDSDQIQLG